MNGLTHKPRLKIPRWHQKLGGKLIAEYFYASVVAGEIFDIVIMPRIHPAGMHQQMCQLMEQGEDLPILDLVVVDVDDGEIRVVQAEAGKSAFHAVHLLLARWIEAVLEYKDTVIL